MFVNPRTKNTWPTEKLIWRAPDDGQYLNLELGQGLTADDIDHNKDSLWRYSKALRLDQSYSISSGEGWTPLVSHRWGQLDVLFKLEYFSPSGSFKDRGISVLLSYLRQYGVKKIVEDSSGNVGASIATYSALGGFDCVIVAPSSAPKPKLAQIEAMGAKLCLVEGSRDQVAEKAVQLSESRFYASHSWHPYFLEGTKTIAFEIWEQCRGSLPDNIIAPLGQGGNILGCYIGFLELFNSGVISKMPRLFGVQAENCAPIHWAANSEKHSLEPKVTLADGIASAEPVRCEEILKALRESEGTTVAVSEENIVKAMHLVHKMGFYVEPTSAAALAGLTELSSEGTICKDEKTLVILTGSGLKATDVVRAHL